MAFRFGLEAVLHFRQSLERQLELRLRTANQQVARMRHLIEGLDRRIADINGQESKHLNSGITAAELHFALLSKASVEEQRHTFQSELLRLERLQVQQQTIFQQARRNRETLESLRESQRLEYEANVRRREQRELDDLFLQRRHHPPRG